MGVSLARYVAASVLLSAGVVYHAFATRQYFYQSTIYLSTSKVAVAAIGNLSFALALCTHRMVIKMFLGSLRDIEQEMVRERLSSAVMESLLALTIFREKFSAFFVAMFASLVFVKVLHWLVQDRIDYVEVTPTISLWQHIRIVTFMGLLLFVDALFLQYTIAGTIQSSGQSVMLLFAFEYVILASTVVRYFLKYLLSMIDLAMEGTWQAKGTYIFYLELVSDLLHLFVYVTFFLIVFAHYGLPLHLVRDLYSTFRNFRTRMQDFLRFRQVTARLDRFPDASADDLRRCDGVCIICREEMAEAGTNKKLFCGHVFHLHCLRSWLERQQNCPTCRASVFRRAAAAQAPAAPGAEGAGEAARDAAAAPQPDAAAAAAGGAAADAAAAAPAVAAATPRAAGTGFGAGPSTSAAAAAAAASPAPAAVPILHDAAQQELLRVLETIEQQVSGAGSSAAAPGATGAPNPAAAAGMAGAMPYGMPPQYPYPYSYPYAHMSPSPMDAMGQGMQLGMVPLMPMVPLFPGYPTAATAVPTSTGPATAATPEQQLAAAAAAAAAAATAALYSPVGSLIMMPPTMIPMAMASAGADQLGASVASAAAFAGAAQAAAAAAHAAQAGGAAPQAASIADMVAASLEATQQVLQQQLAAVQLQLERVKQQAAAGPAPPPAAQPSEAPAPAAAPSSSSSTLAAAAPAAGTAAGPSSAAPADTSQPAAAAPPPAAAPAAADKPSDASPDADTTSVAAPPPAGDSGAAAPSATPAAEAPDAKEDADEPDAQEQMRRLRLQRFGQQ